MTLSGDGLSLVPVDRLATFTVHTKGAGSGSLNVDVTGELFLLDNCIGEKFNAHIKISFLKTFLTTKVR